MTLLEVQDLTLRRDDGKGTAILNDISLDLHDGEVLILCGESGCGKTTLLKCISELNVYQRGRIALHGKTASDYGYPYYRTLVQYIPQRPSILAGTPLDFLKTCQGYASRKKRVKEIANDRVQLDPLDIAEEWGIQKFLWDRDWGTLSGGEAQRIALAIGIGLGGADIILLDEPTSALDAETMRKVEKTLVGLLPPNLRGGDGEAHYPRHSLGPKAIIWITHTPEQAKRCGTREYNMTPHVRHFDTHEEADRECERVHEGLEERAEREERERKEKREREERERKANGDVKSGKKDKK